MFAILIKIIEQTSETSTESHFANVAYTRADINNDGRCARQVGSEVENDYDIFFRFRPFLLTAIGESRGK